MASSMVPVMASDRTDQCPWCRSEIPHDDFLRISEAIRREELTKLAKTREELEAQHRKVLLEAQQKVADAAARLRDVAAEKARREEAARKEREDAAWREAELKAKLAERDAAVGQLESERAELRESVTNELQAAHAGLLKTRLSEQAAALKQEEDARLAKLRGQLEASHRASLEETRAKEKQTALRMKELLDDNAKRAEAARREREEAASREAELKADIVARDGTLARLREEKATLREQITKDVKVEQEKLLAERVSAERTRVAEEKDAERAKELAAQRELLEKDKTDALLRKDSEFNRERDALQRKFSEVERKLKQQTAQQIGDGAELDLYEVLREAFPDDRITRVAHGHAGADVHHEVMHKGEACGLIVLDSKNRQAWRSVYVEKLREDQHTVKATHAVLSTAVFPSGQKELFIDNGVVVVTPARVSHIVRLLRATMISMHRQKLSQQERVSKMTELYAFINSETYRQKLDEAVRMAKKIEEIDADELTAHNKVWKLRGRTTTRLQNVLGEIESDVSAIIARA